MIGLSMIEKKQYIFATTEMIKSLYDEIIELDELLQIYLKTEKIVKENKSIQKDNLLFYAFERTHADSTMVRIRRLLDKDSRTNSLYRVAARIAGKPRYFDRSWYEELLGVDDGLSETMTALVKKWWSKYKSTKGDFIDGNKLMKKADSLQVRADNVVDWINENIAHKSKAPRSEMPIWQEVYDLIDDIKKNFKELYCVLTGSSGSCEVAIVCDWEFTLMVPWLEPSPRYKAIHDERD